MASFLKKLIFLLILVMSSSMSPLTQTENTIIGKWSGEEKPDMQSEIYLGQDGLYYGKVIKDSENTGAMGKTILKKLKYDAKTKSFKGKMSPPDREIELDATITFESPDKLKIVAKKFVITKTIYFSRIK